jgi:pimeloyl-ACP methyl ester carboxylesterase
MRGLSRKVSSFLTFTTLRATFAVLERVAPGPGSALAERLWCTVPRGTVRPPNVLPGRRITVSVHGRAVAAEIWGDGPAVYLMHGWGGSRGRFEKFIPALMKAGHRVVALDAPSHGGSAPGVHGRRRAVAAEFAAALEGVVSECGPAYGIVGYSLGGAAAALVVLDGVPADRVALVAPMVSPLAFAGTFGRVLGLGERVQAGMLERVERRNGRPMSDLDLAARATTRTTWSWTWPVLRRSRKPGRERNCCAPRGWATSGSCAIPRSCGRSSASSPPLLRDSCGRTQPGR